MFNIGDRVCYRASFLRSIGAFTGDIAFARGTIIAIKGDIIRVQWEGENEPRSARKGALSVVNTKRGIADE